MTTADIVEVESEEELRALLGDVMPRAVTKERRSLHPNDRAWIAASPMCLIATAGTDGTCDVSPKGDPPGFVRVLDDTTLAIPERPGNRRADGFRNVLSNPHVGVLFLVPGREETLRINGRARLVRDAATPRDRERAATASAGTGEGRGSPLFDDMTVRGHRPALALLVEIEQVFFHCAKAFKRSALWRPETWPDPASLPSMARIVKDVQPAVTETLEELERYYGREYDRRLYG
jgi:predicted pyridoxine 5'-phosphate oxidase superfamily flavin-nucleotide-binding protein